MRRDGWGGKLRGVTLSAAILIPVIFAGLPAMAQDAGRDAGADLVQRGIDRVCPAPDDGVAENATEFDDLGGVHDEAIRCAAEYGLVSGYSDGSYRPGRFITRGQMATFVAAWIEAATNLTLPAPDEPRFEDAEGSVHSSEIEALAEAGIVGGRVDGSFGPDERLSRGQFARAVVNAISYADVFDVDGPLPPTAVDGEILFDDIAGTTFEVEIGALASSGITIGEDGSFHPDRRVTRGQLATFLMRGADYLDRYQRWYLTAEDQVLVADLSPTVGSDGSSDADEGDGASPEPTGEAWLQIDAFDGRLFYRLDLSGIPGPYDEGFGAAIHLGAPGETGPRVVQLIDGERLDAEIEEGRENGLGAVIVGGVPESASQLRFADLLTAPEQAYVVVATNADPEGAVRGQLAPS